MDLLVALKEIPGSIQIAPGQTFYEQNPEMQEQLVRSGHARFAQPLASAPIPPELQPLEWPGATVVIIASGPSLTEDQCSDVELWRGTPAPELRRVIAINTSYLRAPFADVLYACDGAWWSMYHERALETFPPYRCWTQDDHAAKKYGLRYVKSEATRGLSRLKGVIHQGKNSSYQAMNLAFLAGARRFILLGVDCKGTHWHGDHPEGLNRTLPHAIWKSAFEDLARDFKRDGVEVVNCSPGTALTAFPRGDLETELAR